MKNRNDVLSKTVESNCYQKYSQAKKNVKNRVGKFLLVIARLNNLKGLNLSNNALTTFPKETGSLPQLKT